MRNYLIFDYENMHDVFFVYKDDEGALKHKTRELTLNTISKFKYLKELFSTSTEVIKESHRLAQQFGKDGKIVSENNKQQAKKRSKKELLIEFKMMLKELREEYVLLSKEETSKSEILKNLVVKKNSLVDMYTKRMSEIKIGMEEIKKDLEELPKKISSLKKSMKKGGGNKDLQHIVEEWQKKLDIALTEQRDLEKKKAAIAKDDYEDMRLISEDVVKLELDLKNLK